MTGTGTDPFIARALSRFLEIAMECAIHRRRRRSVPAFSPDRIRRILVLHHYEIGDVLCITPSLRALRRAFPEAHLAVLVAENCRAVVERNPDVNEVLAYRRSKYQSGWIGRLGSPDLLRVIRELRRRRFDLAISMRRPYSNTNAWLAYVSGAPWRLGYLAPASRPFRFFLNLGRSPERKILHEVDSGLELMASIGVPAAGRELTLVPDPEAQAMVRQRLGTAGFGRRHLAFVHISSRREPNRWPLAAFAQVADALHEKFGFSVLLSWAPGDAKNPLFPGDDGKAKEVARLMRTRPLLLRTPTLTELIAAVSVSDFVFSPDGGCVHIAAALGIPQVALFGKAYLEQWRPVNTRSIVLHGRGRADNISVDEVMAAAAAVVSRWGRDAGDAASADAAEPGQAFQGRGGAGDARGGHRAS